MKSREERKALHRTPSRRIRTDSVTKSTNATNIVKKGGRIYQETTIDGQKVYNEVQTSPSTESRTSNTSTIENLSITTVNTGGGTAPDSSVEDHSRLHDINSSLDHTGTLSVAKGGTGATTLTDGGILLGSGENEITSMAALGDGEMIVGDGTTDPVAESGATLRTSIGIGTGDSPQFTAIELGHASNTTIARSGAGDITIEGNHIYRAGGTDVAVTDGGTGTGSLTDGGVLLGSGENPITAMAVLGNGEMIVGDGSGDPVAESGATLRTSIGVGTGDSVEFLSLTIGNFTLSGTELDLSSGDFTLDIAGDIILDAGGGDIEPGSTEVNIGKLNNKFGTIHAKSLMVETLVAQDTLATIGGRILVGQTTELTTAVETGDETIYVKHGTFSNNDYVCLQANGKFEIMKLTGAPGGSGPYTHTVSRSLDGGDPQAWDVGDAVFNIGGSAGDGFIDLYSIHGLDNTNDEGPTIVGNIRTGTSWNNWEAMWAIGNLDNIYGDASGLFNSTKFGVGLGKWGAESLVITDSDIKFFNNGTQTAAWEADVITLGNNNDTKIVLNGSSGDLTIGSKITLAGSGGVATVTNIELNGAIKFADIDADADATGRNIRIGTNNGTANDENTYQNILIGASAGAALAGDTDNNKNAVNNVAIGTTVLTEAAANNSASYKTVSANTAVGFSAMKFWNTGDNNTAIGSSAMHNSSNTTTNSDGNTAVGAGTLTSIGDGANYNTVIGFSGASGTTNSITTGSGNVWIGALGVADTGMTATGDNQLRIGTFDGSSNTNWITGTSSGRVSFPNGTGAISSSGAITATGAMTIDAGTSGDAVLYLKSDSDNNEENDNPRIEFWQDGTSGEWSAIGHGVVNSADTGSVRDNVLGMANSVGSGGISFATANNTSGVAWTNAVERLWIDGTGVFNYPIQGSTVAGHLVGFFHKTGISDATATTVFTITTTDSIPESSEGGCWMAVIEGLATHAASAGTGASAAYGFRCIATHSQETSGIEDISSVSSDFSGAASTSDGSRTISSVTGTFVDTSEHVKTFQININLAGSVTTGAAYLKCELYWGGYTDSPTLTQG